MSAPPPGLSAALSGRYTLERELGEGGMATVYLARDLRHNRAVALKVLKPELAAVVGAERFLAEIQTTANLQHPHILPLFDSGEADSFLFYVMPYVEGETLRDRLDREKQLPVDEAVRIATDVAEALQTAHEQGVIHRDIKPANILMSRGRPLVADFGIALAVSAAGGHRLTETGLSVGTPYYMSPEQAAADREPTAASDVYSLGCVLYEMLVGEPPHTGASAQAVLAKILTDDAPAATRARASVPAHVDAAVRRALEKLPADRFGSAQAFAQALHDPGFRYGVVEGVGVAPGGPWKARAFVSTALFLVASGLAAWGWLRPASERHVARYAIRLPDERPLLDLEYAIDILPDGSALVYAGTEDDGQALFLRRMDQLESTRIQGTEDAFNPAVSPDGARVAFITEGLGRPRALRVGALAGGGGAVMLTDSLVDPGGVSWGHDGYIYYDSQFEGDGLGRIPEDGGEPQRMTVPDPAVGEYWHFQPEALPTGRGVLFSIARGDAVAASEYQIAVAEAPGEPHRVILEAASMPRFTTSGHLLFVRVGQLMAVPFDLDRLEPEGTPVPVQAKLATRTLGRAHLAISDNGTLVYLADNVSSWDLEFVWRNRAGNAEPVDSTFIGNFGAFELSPDGRTVAVGMLDRATRQRDLWVADLTGGGSRRLTFTDGSVNYPTWTPDGRQIAFSLSGRVSEDWGLFSVPADGGALPQLVVPLRDRIPSYIDYSPREPWLVLTRGNVEARDFFAKRLDTGGDEIPLMVGGPAREPRISPDGRWLAYASRESGQWEVYVRPFPEVHSAKTMVSRGGGYLPRWSADGSELFFVSADNQVMAAEVLPGAAFGIRPPTPLFFREGRIDLPFDVHPDGQRFLTLTPVRQGGAGQGLVVVENFLEELRGR